MSDDNSDQIIITAVNTITHPDYEKVKLNFKGYEKIVLKGIERAKKEYFDSVCGLQM